MKANLLQIVQAKEKPAKLIFESSDPELMSKTFAEIAMLQEKPVDLYFHLRLTDPARETQMKLMEMSGGAHPAAPAMIYEDADGNRYFIDESVGAEGLYLAVKVGPGEDDEPVAVEQITPEPVSQADAQGALNAYALKADWKPVSVPELLAEMCAEAQDDNTLEQAQAALDRKAAEKGWHPVESGEDYDPLKVDAEPVEQTLFEAVAVFGFVARTYDRERVAQVIGKMHAGHEPNQVQLRWFDGAPDEAVLEDVFNTAFVAVERPARNYHDAAGNRQIFVGQGLGRGDDPWMSLYQTLDGSTAIHRLKSPRLPERPTRDEAQADLDEYAASKDWPVFNDRGAIPVMPGVVTYPETRAAHGDEPEQTPEPEPKPPPPDPFAKDREHLFDEGEQSQSGGTRTGPPLSSYVRVGDWVALLPDVAAKMKGEIFLTGKPKPSQVRSINPEERSVQIASRGTVLFKDLDSDWRLVLSANTINVGDVVENGMMAARVAESTDAIVRLQDLEKPNSPKLNISWAELDERWSIKERAAVTVASGAIQERTEP